MKKIKLEVSTEPTWVRTAYLWFDGARVTKTNYLQYVNAFSDMANTIKVSSSLPKKLYRSIRAIDTKRKNIVTEAHIQSWSDTLGAVEDFAAKKKYPSNITELTAKSGMLVLYSHAWDTKLIDYLKELKTENAKNLIEIRSDYAGENEILIYSASGKFNSKLLSQIEGKEEKPQDYLEQDTDWGEAD